MFRVAEGIYRGPRPDIGFWLEASGKIKTVLNLEGGIIEAFSRNNKLQQMQSVFAHMETVRIEMNAILAPDRSNVEFALYCMNQDRLKPIYVHCLHGVDRTGFVIAARRMAMGWTYDAAVAEMKSIGFHSWYWYWLRALRRYEGKKYDY